MKSIGSFKQGVVKAQRHWTGGRYDQALAEVDRLLEDWPQNSQLLVMRSNLICLQDRGDLKPSLDDARMDLEAASKLDADSPSPLIELGYFHYVYQDDALEANKYFDKAVSLCVDLLSQALVGQAEARSELGHEARSFDALMTACSLATHYRGSMRETVLERIKILLNDTLGAESVSTNESKR